MGFDRHFHSFQFQAFETKVLFLKQLRVKNYLLALGLDYMLHEPLLKIWDLDKFDKRGSPVCLKIVKLSLPKPAGITCFAESEDSTQISIGTDSGLVILIKCDWSKERLGKQKIIHEDKEPIYGLGFKKIETGNVLFIASSKQVMLYPSRSRDGVVKTFRNGIDCVG